MLNTNLLIYLAMFLALILFLNNKITSFIQKIIYTIQDGQQSSKDLLDIFAQKSREENLGNILKLGENINSYIANLVKNQNSILSDISQKNRVINKR